MLWWREMIIIFRHSPAGGVSHQRLGRMKTVQYSKNRNTSTSRGRECSPRQLWHVRTQPKCRLSCRARAGQTDGWHRGDSPTSKPMGLGTATHCGYQGSKRSLLLLNSAIEMEIKRQSNAREHEKD